MKSLSVGASSSEIEMTEYTCRSLRVVLSDAGSIPAASTMTGLFYSYYRESCRSVLLSSMPLHFSPRKCNHQRGRTCAVYCKSLFKYGKLYVMRKLITVLTVLVILSVSGTGHPVEMKPSGQRDGVAPAGSAADVTLRFSKHEGFSRIVFETAEEPFIKNSTVTAEKNQIKVLFPSSLHLTTQGTPDMVTSLKGNLYTITVNSPFRIKVLRLSSPPRLSIDIMVATKDEGRRPAATEGTVPVITANIRVVLDPGHGGYEVGIVSGELREKDITFSLARSLEAALLKRNKTVFLTRKADQFLSITDRAIFTNQRSPDIFISIHLSTTDNFVIYTASAETASPDTTGELYGLMSRQRRYIEKSKALAEGLGNAIKEEFKKDIVFRKMDIPLLASVGAASVMVELPVTIASDQSVKTRIAEVLLKGIASYAGQ